MKPSHPQKAGRVSATKRDKAYKYEGVDLIPETDRKRIVNSILKNEETATRFLIDAGIMTKEGKLLSVFEE